MRIIPRLFILTLAVPLAGCAIDVVKLVDRLSRPDVVFADPSAFDCPPETIKLQTRQGLDDCVRCTNSTAALQGVTVNKQPQYGVAPGKHVFICPLGTVIVQGQPPL